MRERGLEALSLAGIGFIILSACWPVITSGQRVNSSADFFQYVARHEHVRQALLKDHTLPQRSHLLGGGYPTIGDPEDPTFSPFVLVTLSLGSILGIKWIGIVGMLLGAAGLYLLGRSALGYSRLAAFASALFLGLSLWMPVRMRDGNPNEIYPMLIPLCLMCLHSLRRHRRVLIFLVFLLMTMLSDGKLTFFASSLYLLTLCLMASLPGVKLWDSTSHSIQPLKWLGIALGLTVVLGLFRILPIFDLVQMQGSFSRMPLSFHRESYGPATIDAYTLGRFLREAIAWKGEAGLERLSSVCIGWVPIGLAMVGSLANVRGALPWLAGMALTGWLALAHHAPIDLFGLLWPLPIFNAIDNPGKYFAFFPVLSICVLSGFGLDAMRRSRRIAFTRVLRLLLVVIGVSFLFLNVYKLSARAYTHQEPPDLAVQGSSFYQIQGSVLKVNRVTPWEGNSYVNIRRGVGTLDWYTGLPLTVFAQPRYFVVANGALVANPDYKGECFLKPSGKVNRCEISYHQILVDAVVTEPATLIINQNYHPDWRAEQGEILADEGRLALALPAGAHEIVLSYRSRAFVQGLLLSFAALLGLGFAWGLYRYVYLARRDADDFPFR